MTEFQKHLRKIGACAPARKWAGNRTAEQAWKECENSSWLLWWATRDGAVKQDIVKVVCEISRSVIHLDKTPKALLAIEAAERWISNPSKDNEDLAGTAARECWGDAAAYAAAYVAAYAAAYVATDAAVYAANAAAGAKQNTSLEIIRSNLKQPWSEAKKDDFEEDEEDTIL